jgi:hypothetical protein
MDHYQGNDRVQFIFLDNGVGAKGEVSIVEPQNARAFLRSMNFDNLEVRLKETLDAELKAGRISEEVHRGTANALAKATGPEARRGSGEQPQQGAPGRPGDPAARTPEEVAASARGALTPTPLEALRSRMEEQRFAARPKQIENMRAMIAMQEGEVAAAAVHANRKLRPKGTGADDRAFLKMKREALESNRRELAELERQQATNEWPRIPEEELLFAAESRGIEIEPEAPAAKPGGEAEPPPPRGRAPGEAAGAEGLDPIRLEAERFAQANEKLMLRVGEEPDGTPILKSVREYLDDVQAKAKAAREDMGLFEAAAQCLLGRA